MEIVDGRLLRSAQAADGLLARPPFRVLAFDLGDHVAAAKSLLVRRGSFEDVEDRDVAIDDVDRDAEAVVATLLPLAHLREAAGVHEARMRIERLQHAADGAVDQPVRFVLPDVVLLDGAEGRREDFVLVRNLILGDKRVAPPEPAGYGTKDDDEPTKGEETRAAHPKHITSNVHPCLDPVQKGFP